MVEELPNSVLLVSYGDWYIRLGNLYLGWDRMQVYQKIEEQISWITNHKIRVYIHVKMIKGDSFLKAVNRVLSKLHLYDEDYRNILRE